jgi:ferredoxin
MRIEVDRDVCFGSGECVLAAPQVFELDAAGLSRVRSDAGPIDLISAQRIAENCPSGAIKVIDDGSPTLAREE